MLRRLLIKNFAIIEDIECNFYDGMNVIIGETGAGKSIIIDALGLLMGNRSSFEKIRNGKTKAFIEGEFYIEDKQIIDRLNEEYEDLISDDNILVVSRTLDTSNKSSCKISSRSVSISVLRSIMEEIVDIHSQHKDQSYFDETKQILFLDNYIERKEVKGSTWFNLKKDYKLKFNQYLEEKTKLERMKEEFNSLDDIEYLRYQYNEIEKAEIKDNELEDIENEIQILSSFEKLASSFGEFSSYFEEASSLLYQAKKASNSIKDEDIQLDITRFNEAYYELEDAYESAKSKFEKYQDNLQRMDYLIQRRSTLRSLARKYGNSTSSILARFEEIKEKIELSSNYDYMLEKQENIIFSLSKELEKIGNDISLIRHKYSEDLSSSINSEIHDLLLENASFKVEVTSTNINKNGIDNVKFLLCANAGGKYMSLSSTASLGETSRINLAIKTIFNQLSPTGTIIFDEIDTGISGRVGVAVSKKLHKISSNSQTIVISHLPQVAANGEHTFYVKKIVKDGSTQTLINEIDYETKVEEIAKMLSSSIVSKDTLNAAKELMDTINN
ncbi:MAG: DNA repair protein RecN [Bacilli bacterium]